MPYTPKQMIEVIRTIGDILLEPTNHHLEQDGVWRVNGAADVAQDIVAKILEGRKWDPSQFEYKNFTDAIKTVILDSSIFANDNPILAPLKAIMDDDTTIDATAAMAAMRDMVGNLMDTDNIDNQYIAEIIHTLFHLCHQTKLFAEQNQMHAGNLGITPLGQFLGKTLGLVDSSDPIAAIAKTDRAAELGASTIEADVDNPFAAPFEMLYMNRAIEARQAMIDQMETDQGTVQRMFDAQAAAIGKISQQLAQAQTDVVRLQRHLANLETHRKRKQITKEDYQRAKEEITTTLELASSTVDGLTAQHDQTLGLLKREQKEMQQRRDDITGLRASQQRLASPPRRGRAVSPIRDASAAAASADASPRTEETEASKPAKRKKSRT